MEENNTPKEPDWLLPRGIAAGDHFFIFYSGFYISMTSGKAYYAGIDEGGILVDGAGGNYLPMRGVMEPLDLDTLNLPNREDFFAAAARVRDHVVTQLERTPEAKHLVAHYGTDFLINLEPEVGLDSQLGFVRSPREQYRAGGTAHVARNVIRIDKYAASSFQGVWDEEVGHMLDGVLAPKTNERDRTRFLSDAMVTDSVLETDWNRVTVALSLKDDNRFFDSFSAAMEKANVSYMPKLEAFVSKDAAMNGQQDTMLAANYMLHDYRTLKEKLRNILKLDWDVYNEIRGTRDGEDKNPHKDTEVMVKFHVLRMQMEQEYAGDGPMPDYFATNTPAIKALEALAPSLAKAYSTKWLPMVHATLRIEDEAVREAVRAAFEVTPKQAYGVVTNEEIAKIEAAMKASGGEHLLEVRNLTGTMNDVLVVDGNALPAQLPTTLKSSSKAIDRS